MNKPLRLAWTSVVHTLYVKANIYHPQRSWGKVYFSQASVILFTGVGGWGCRHLGRPPWQGRPPSKETPPAQCMLGDMDNKRAVCILLECNSCSINWHHLSWISLMHSLVHNRRVSHRFSLFKNLVEWISMVFFIQSVRKRSKVPLTKMTKNGKCEPKISVNKTFKENYLILKLSFYLEKKTNNMLHNILLNTRKHPRRMHTTGFPSSGGWGGGSAQPPPDADLFPLDVDPPSPWMQTSWPCDLWCMLGR